MVKALDSSSNGRVVRVGSNPTPGMWSPKARGIFALVLYWVCLLEEASYFFIIIDKTINESSLYV